MAGQSAVNRQAMGVAAGQVDDSANMIRGLQSQLQGHKAEVRAQWEGNASMAFETVFNAFDRDFNQVLKAMEGMYEALVHTKLVYEAKEQEAGDAVNRVHQLLNNA
jgi:WXG100 family type VII secretion target